MDNMDSVEPTECYMAWCSLSNCADELCSEHPSPCSQTCEDEACVADCTSPSSCPEPCQEPCPEPCQGPCQDPCHQQCEDCHFDTDSLYPDGEDLSATLAGIPQSFHYDGFAQGSFPTEGSFSPVGLPHGHYSQQTISQQALPSYSMSQDQFSQYSYPRETYETLLPNPLNPNNHHNTLSTPSLNPLNPNNHINYQNALPTPSPNPLYPLNHQHTFGAPSPNPLNPLNHQNTLPTPSPNPLNPNNHQNTLPTPSPNSLSPAGDWSSGLNHMCLWQEPGDSEVCGDCFSSTKELMEHLHEVHAPAGKNGKNSKNGKAVAGPSKDREFWCRWKGCERTEPFTVNAKLRRHLTPHSQRKFFCIAVITHLSHD